MRNPTSCGTKTTTGFDANVLHDTNVTGSASFESVNCAALDFSPELEVDVGAPRVTGHSPTRRR